MGNRTAKFTSALVGSIIAGVPLAAVSQNAPSAPAAASTANAATDCLASPKGIAPQGQHWFYRVERGTKRQCWYLRAEGAKENGKTATTAQTASSSPQPDSPPPQSVQNAHAEYVASQSAAAQQAPAAATAPPATQPATAAGSEPQQPALAARRPDSNTAAAQASQPAQDTADDAQPSAQPTASPAPVTLAAANVPADKPTGSVQMLLLVIGGALALAGVLGSVIYRFAGGRARTQTADRRVNWDYRQDDNDSRAPWHNEPVPVARVARPLPVDFDAVRPPPPQIAAFTDALGRIASQARPTHVAAAEPVDAEVEFFDRESEIETPAPQLTAGSEGEEPGSPHVDDDSRTPRHAVLALRAKRPLRVDFDAVRPEAPKIAAFSDEIRRIATQGRPTVVASAEPDDTEISYFDGEFEIEAPAPQLAADAHNEEAVEADADAHEDQAREENTVDIDIITAMLERLATEGPRLTQPSPEPSLEADLAALARSSRGQSAARA